MDPDSSSNFEAIQFCGKLWPGESRGRNSLKPGGHNVALNLRTSEAPDRNPVGGGSKSGFIVPPPAGRQTYPTMYVFRVVHIYFPMASDDCMASNEWVMPGSDLMFESCGHYVGGNYVFFKFHSEGKKKTIVSH